MVDAPATFPLVLEAIERPRSAFEQYHAPTPAALSQPTPIMWGVLVVAPRFIPDLIEPLGGIQTYFALATGRFPLAGLTTVVIGDPTIARRIRPPPVTGSVQDQAEQEGAVQPMPTGLGPGL